MCGAPVTCFRLLLFSSGVPFAIALGDIVHAAVETKNQQPASRAACRASKIPFVSKLDTGANGITEQTAEYVL